MSAQLSLLESFAPAATPILMEASAPPPSALPVSPAAARSRRVSVMPKKDTDLPLPPLPRLGTVEENGARVRQIFDGTGHLGSDIAVYNGAFVITTFLYIGAIGGKAWLRPNHIVWMPWADLAPGTSDEQRHSWLRAQPETPKELRFSAPNSRESWRDELIRDILTPMGMVLPRTDVSKNYGGGQHTLADHFAALFDPDLTGDDLVSAIKLWRETYLSAEALARVRLFIRSREAAKERVRVQFPDGSARMLPPGQGSVLERDVVELLAPLKLAEPSVLALADGGKSYSLDDERVLAREKLVINHARLQPDVILMDSGPVFRLVFVEAAATGGPMTRERIEALTEIAVKAGFMPESLRFVTAFKSRSCPVARKLLRQIPVGSYVWYADEPNMLIPFFETETSF